PSRGDTTGDSPRPWLTQTRPGTVPDRGSPRRVRGQSPVAAPGSVSESGRAGRDFAVEVLDGVGEPEQLPGRPRAELRRVRVDARCDGEPVRPQAHAHAIRAAVRQLVRTGLAGREE